MVNGVVILWLAMQGQQLDESNKRMLDSKAGVLTCEPDIIADNRQHDKYA